MKKIYSLLILSLSATAGFAQNVTLNQSSYTNMVIMADSFGGISSSSGFPTLTTGANQFWDFSVVTYDKKYYSEQFTGTNASLPNATWYSSRNYKPGSLDSLYFETDRWSGITATGFQRIGETIKRKAIGLGQFGAPFVNTDSLVILQQTQLYSNPYNLIKFPATLNSSWAESFDLVVNGELTIGFYSLNHAPFKYKSNTAYTFSCPGSGKCLMVRFDGSTGEDKVLMERILGVTTDSFFINGAPAAVGILSNLGLTQNKITNNNFDELFRANEVNALVLYLYGADNTFSTVQSGQVQVLRVPFPDKVESISKDGKMALYPNPVGNGRQLFVKLSSPATGDYSYSIRQITGAVVGKGNIIAKGQAELSISLPNTLSNGVYWLSLLDKNGEVAVAPFRLQE